MKGIYQIPESFWSLFKSKNRYIYMESLLVLYEEYLYNDYFLTKETCIQLLADCFSNRLIDISADDTEEEADSKETEPVASRIFSRLTAFSWLRKIEDYGSFCTNVVIPDYASVFIETFQRVNTPDADETDLYIQNIYANIYSFYHDKKAGLELLKTAGVNTARLNRALQELLHNMDKFFEALLKQESYEALLQEHLESYIETIVNKKYALLKTGDNFYIYKNDIKTLISAIRQDNGRLSALLGRQGTAEGQRETVKEDMLEILDHIERGIANMERRIARIDAEHSRYVRATVRRLEYMLNSDDNSRGTIIQLLSMMSGSGKEKLLKEAAGCIGLRDGTILSSYSMYKKRGKRKSFEETIPPEEIWEKELTAAEIVKLNQNKNRYGKRDIENFVMERMENHVFVVGEDQIRTDEEFALLILAYDYSIRKKSPFRVRLGEEGQLGNKAYSFPGLVFEMKERAVETGEEEPDDTLL